MDLIIDPVEKTTVLGVASWQNKSVLVHRIGWSKAALETVYWYAVTERPDPFTPSSQLHLFTRSPFASFI